METICNPAFSGTSGVGKPDVKLPSSNRKSTLDESNNSLDSNLKIKRCKHGRIIVKDLSKKKPVQPNDGETNNQSPSKAPNVEGSSHNQQSSCDELPLMQSSESTAVPPNEAKISNTRGTGSPIETETISKSDKLCETKRNSPEHTRIERIRSPLRRRSRTKSPLRRNLDDRSPSYRKSPRRNKARSSRRNRHKSPRRRRDRGRIPPGRRVSSHNTSSEKCQHRRSRRDRTPPGSLRRRPSRDDSPRRRRSSSRSLSSSSGSGRSRIRSKSRSRSRSRSRSGSRKRDIYRTSYSPYRSRSRSPGEDSRRRHRSLRDPIDDTVSRSKEVLDKSPDRLIGRANTSSSTIRTDNFITSKLVNEPELPKKSTQECHKTIKHQEQPVNQPTKHDSLSETVQPQSSPKVSPATSMTLSTEDSVSSDIYDPEGPIIPISPGDSPPLSPLFKAANNRSIYQSDGREKNDDDVPSSAVQLNQQEKYLQKLNRQERVVEEVKVALKPHYQRRAINKDQYKDVLRRAVPKVS